MVDRHRRVRSSHVLLLCHFFLPVVVSFLCSITSSVFCKPPLWFSPPVYAVLFSILSSLYPLSLALFHVNSFPSLISSSLSSTIEFPRYLCIFFNLCRILYRGDIVFGSLLSPSSLYLSFPCLSPLFYPSIQCTHSCVMLSPSTGVPFLLISLHSFSRCIVRCRHLLCVFKHNRR